MVDKMNDEELICKMGECIEGYNNILKAIKNYNENELQYAIMLSKRGYDIDITIGEGGMILIDKIEKEDEFNEEFIEEVLKNKESDPSERIDISTEEKQRELLGLTDGEYKLKEGERIRTGFKLHKSKSMRYNGFGNEKGTPLKELSKEELIEFAEKLYSIIDDIDTAGDIAKDSDKIFRGLVDEAIDKREKFMTCDCYDILVK